MTLHRIDMAWLAAITAEVTVSSRSAGGICCHQTSSVHRSNHATRLCTSHTTRKGTSGKLRCRSETGVLHRKNPLTGPCITSGRWR